MVTLLREPARPAAIREHPLAPWFAVATVCFGAFMGQLDASVVTVAFPALQRQFGTGLAATQWVSLAYLLALTALLVQAGRWSDRAGRKLLYLYGFVVFSAASAACGLAPSLGALIALRVVQAAGAALLQANSVALVVTSVPVRARRAALGIQAAAQAVGLACGPVVGGVLVADGGLALGVPHQRAGGAARGGGRLVPAAPDQGRPGQCRRRRRRPGRDRPAGRVDVGRDAGHLVPVGARPCRPGPRRRAWSLAVTTGAALVRHSWRAAAPLLDLRALAGQAPARPSAARSAPTWSCSGRWCCSRR